MADSGVGLAVGLDQPEPGHELVLGLLVGRAGQAAGHRRGLVVVEDHLEPLGRLRRKTLRRSSILARVSRSSSIMLPERSST